MEKKKNKNLSCSLPFLCFKNSVSSVRIVEIEIEIWILITYVVHKVLFVYLKMQIPFFNLP